jgi:NAD+ synthase (glutamine-hydrolysing)
MVVFDTRRDVPDAGQIRESDPEEKAAVFKALVMGTRDYLHKCRFKTAIIGLSGGVDSALTAVVAAEALGPENVLTVFMPSRYTSQDNYQDTRLLAENLNVAYDVVPIDDMYAAFLRFLPLNLDADNPGITEQNIQARVRGSLLMAYANQRGSLVLSTGNKSEMAVGYCTLYGDMNGGLAVIADVPKTLVYAVCRHINRTTQIIPLRILEKAPSAELKPDQTDQDDLPPYEVIDPILAAYIERLESVDAIVAQGFDRRTVTDVIQRVHRNEYKRRQAAPGLKVTPKAFGEGRRLPIAQRYRPE